MTETLLFFFGGRAERDILVVKAAVAEGERSHFCCKIRGERRAGSEALARHRQQVWRLILDNDATSNAAMDRSLGIERYLRL